MKKRIAAGIVLVIMLISVFACTGGGGGSNDDTKNPTQDTTRIKQSSVEAVDYEGYGFVFADQKLKEGNRYDHRFPEIFAEADSDEAVNVGVYRRNDILQTKYNIDIISNVDLDKDALHGSLQAGDDVCDAICFSPYDSKACVMDGFVLNLKNYDNIFNFDQSWWWGEVNNEIAINNKYFQVTGDANIRSLGSVNVMFYNKEVARDYIAGCDENDALLYELVDKGGWTFDKMLEFAKNISKDNGDSVWDQNDQYGLAENNFATIAFFYGCGCRFVTMNKDGEPEFKYGDAKQVEVLTDIVNMVNDVKYCFYAEPYKNLYDNARALLTQELFSDNRTLFVTDLLSRGLLMREVEQDYGILPMPKYNEEQGKYIQYLHGNSSFMSIPFTVTDADRSARVLEDLVFYATDTVRAAYIDNLVKQKMARDEGSQRMVEIIFGNVTFDMGYYGIGQMDADLRGMADNNDTNFTSFFSSKSKVWQRNLENYLKSFKEREE